MTHEALFMQELLDIKRILHETKLQSKEVLTLKEAASFTGLSESYIYKLTSSKQIPHSNPRGKTLYFQRTALEEWMLKNPQETIEDYARAAADANFRRK
jgi:excisionase family DNA binding protein